MVPLMGLYAAKNAVLVAAQRDLGHVAARLFLHMALECWDDEDNPTGQAPRRYFAARESSAIALGYLAPANGTEQAHHAVKRAVRELVDKGAIRRISQGRNGHTAEFELLVDSRAPFGRHGFPQDVVSLSGRSRKGAAQRPPQVAIFSPPKGAGEWPAKGAAQRPS